MGEEGTADERRHRPGGVDPTPLGDQAAPDHFAGMGALLRTHRAMTETLQRALEPFDLTLTAYLLLTTLLMSRDATRPLGQLSKHLMIHPTTVTLLIDQLEKRELVGRLPHPSDRRIVLARLSPTGRRLTLKASEAAATHNFGLGPLDDDGARRLAEILRSVRQGLGDTV